jgi:N-carbamoyl-L-amino-acid hydrolase
VELGKPIAVASGILAHGRWTLTFRGEGNHAGATPMNQRRDPMILAAQAVLEIENAARALEGSRATVGRIHALPGASNAIASAVTVSLDARARTDPEVRALVADIDVRVHADEFLENSWSPEVLFDEGLNERVKAALHLDVPVLHTGAGHDAGILAGFVPSAMLFVRNPTGVSHSPSEHADESDCRAGAVALEDVLRSLL